MATDIESLVDQMANELIKTYGWRAEDFITATWEPDEPEYVSLNGGYTSLRLSPKMSTFQAVTQKINQLSRITKLRIFDSYQGTVPGYVRDKASSPREYQHAVVEYRLMSTIIGKLRLRDDPMTRDGYWFPNGYYDPQRIQGPRDEG